MDQIPLLSPLAVPGTGADENIERSRPVFEPAAGCITGNPFSREGFTHALFGARAFKLEECHELFANQNDCR
jgi:hypothetical protein